VGAGYAQSCLAGGLYTPAFETFQEILRENPDSVAAHLLLAQALDGLNRDEDAMKELRAVIRTSPAEPTAHFSLGFLYWKAKRYEEAAAEFRQELKYDPANALALGYLGDIEMKKGDETGARRDLATAQRLSGSVRVASLDLGILDTKAKNYSAAIANLDRAAKLDPTQPDAYYRLATVYKSLGKQQEAEKNLAMVRTLHRKGNEDLLHRVSGAAPIPAMQ